MSEWIKCSERMPDGETYNGPEGHASNVVLLFFGEHNIRSGVRWTSEEQGDAWLESFEGGEIDEEPTHWMPLPTPPEAA